MFHLRKHLTNKVSKLQRISKKFGTMDSLVTLPIILLLSLVIFIHSSTANGLQI